MLTETVTDCAVCGEVACERDLVLDDEGQVVYRQCAGDADDDDDDDEE